jgi:hypothetical protein
MHPLKINVQPALGCVYLKLNIDIIIIIDYLEANAGSGLPRYMVMSKMEVTDVNNACLAGSISSLLGRRPASLRLGAVC